MAYVYLRQKIISAVQKKEVMPKRRRVWGGEEDEESDVEETATIQVTGNHVWFFGDVDSSSCLDLITNLHRVFEREKTKTKGRIFLHLQTSGGWVFSAFNVFDIIQAMKTKVRFTIICEGEVASSGTIILLAADERFIRPNGALLIHEVSGGAIGKYSKLKTEIANIEMLYEMLLALYKSKTLLNKTSIGKILKKNKYFDANTCLANGLITKITRKYLV